MIRSHLDSLVCPDCWGNLAWVGPDSSADTIDSGGILCASCGVAYPIIGGVGRFVVKDNYAASFGFEWNLHPLTHHDEHSGLRISEERFFAETGWPRELREERILEVGGGSGRFTRHAASTGAFVVSADLSEAAEVNQRIHGHLRNLLIVQADLRRLPVRQDWFDRIYCLGVLQHTPDPQAAFSAIVKYAKPGGVVAVDVYRRLEWWKQWAVTKYWVRPFTRRMNPAGLHVVVERYVRTMWPLAKLFRRLPKGRALSWRMLIADYHGVLPLSDAQLQEWAVLDAFDMLSPKYDFPQRVEDVRCWFEKAGMEDVVVERGHNGIVGRGRRPQI